MSRKHLFLVLLSVFLLTLSTPPYPLTFLRWFSLIPFLFFISRKDLSRKEKVSGAIVLGYGYSLIQYSTFFSLLPLDWLNIENGALGALIIFFIWAVLSFVVSFWVFIVIFSENRIYLLPFFWIFAEVLRSWTYSFFVWGGSSDLSDSFSWGFLSYSAHTSSLLLFLAPLLGIYGISFVVASVNVFFFYSGIFLKENYKKALFIFVGVIVLIFAEIFPFTSYFSEEGNNLVTVLVLQGNNPFIFSYDDSYFKKSVYAYKESLEEGLSCYPETDIIVIPESSNFLPMLSFFEGRNEGFLAQELLRGRRERLLIYGDYDREENVSLVEVVSNEGTSQSLYKNLLMPLGEYPPYLVVFFAKIFGQEGWISEVSSVRNIKNIQNADKIAKTSFGKIAALECSEILSPSVYRKIKKEKPDMVFHLQRLSAFHEDTRVFRYMLAASQVRAAELRIPIIGAVDGSGYSYVIDKFGEIQKIGNKDTKFISAEISI